MIRQLFGLLLVACLVLAAVPGSATTLDEVVARHIESHGGRDAWQAVNSLKITGSFTAFSVTKHFTLLRGPERRYHMDHYHGDRHVVIGFDGQRAWWVNPWYGVDWPIPISGADLLAMERDLDLPTPLFDHGERGHKLELVGTADLDGQEVLQVDVTRADGTTESWFLDTDTCLEVARDSPGSDFGNPMPQRTYFDDFRQVGSLVLPFHVESEFYTRHRVMEVDGVELDVELDPDIFRAPVPAGMAALRQLVGGWEVEIEQRRSPNAPWSKVTTRAEITGLVGETLLQERYLDGDGLEVLGILGHDRFRDRFVLTQVHALTSYPDIRVGSFAEDRLILSNVEPDTSWTGYGRTFHSRTTYTDLSQAAFSKEIEISIDGGENWFLAQRMSYQRARKITPQE